MIRRLIAKEILINLLSLRLSFAFLILVPLVVISVYILCNDYAQRKADYDAKVSLHMRTAYTDTITLDRPPSPLMVLVGGTIVTTGNTVQVSYYDAPHVKGGFDHTPIFYIFPRTDYLFVIGIVMSLLALLFSYNAISGEREGGTLRLVLANSVPRDIVLLSKWVGGYLSALFPCMTALLLGIIMFALHPAIDLTLADWWAIFLLLLIAGIYLAIFFSLGVFISAISSTTGSSAMRCLFAWIILALIIPNVAPHIARYFAPNPPIQEMERKYDQILADTAQKRYSEHAEASERLSNTEPVTRDEFMRILTRIRKKIEEIEYSHLSRQRDQFRQLANDHDNTLKRQIQLSRILSACSPYAIFTDVATALANTDGEAQVDFLRKIRQYEDDYFDSQYREGAETGRGIHRFDPVRNPLVFHLTTPNLHERIQQSLPEIGLLMLFGVLCFMAGYLLFLRRAI
jgi:ABC-type transport system involved in multi-copper enzyme maturation permease subunit